jgi:hypothetical protein
MKTGTFTSLFAAAAIVGGLAMMVPADAGSKHEKKNGSCNWSGCSTQWDTKHKNVNIDLRLRAIVVYQDCNGQACAGGATTGYATAYANDSEAGASAGGSTDSYAGAGYGGLSVGYNDSDSNNTGSATSSGGSTATASSRQESTSVAGSIGGLGAP